MSFRHQTRSLFQGRYWSELQIPLQSLRNPLHRHGAWEGTGTGCDLYSDWTAGGAQQYLKSFLLVLQAGMFSIVPTIISVGSGLALMGAVSSSTVSLHLANCHVHTEWVPSALTGSLLLRHGPPLLHQEERLLPKVEIWRMPVREATIFFNLFFFF